MNSLHRPASPVDVVVLGLPDATVGPALATSISNVVDSGAARVLDALWIQKDANGEVTVFDVDDERASELFGFDSTIPGLLGVDEVTEIAHDLPAGTAAAIIAWENTWAAGISHVVSHAGGFVLAHERIPASAVEELLKLADAVPTEES